MKPRETTISPRRRPVEAFSSSTRLELFLREDAAVDQQLAERNPSEPGFGGAHALVIGRSTPLLDPFPSSVASYVPSAETLAAATRSYGIASAPFDAWK